MRPVLIFRHVDNEGPGYLQDFLIKQNIPFKLVCIDKGDPVPSDPGQASGLVFMGGNMSVNDPLDWIAAELKLIRDANEHGIPVLGHCLGGQLIARAMGASVSQNRVSEIGWHITSTVVNDNSETWLQDLQHELELFHWHSETFSLPKAAVQILKSEFCENQGFVLGKTIALQCHIEMTEALVLNWAEKGRQKLTISSSVQSADEMTHDLPTRIARLNRIADQIYSHWIRGLIQA